MINIQPIKLLSGSHDDTGSTGQGCFMNVIAYLNGEPQITDRSECVCVTIRPIAIWLNDFMRDDERQQLVPFVMRAMGTATEDKQVIIDRLKEVVSFSEDMASLAAKSAARQDAKSAAEYAARYAAKYAAEYAKSAAEYAARYAAKSAATCAAINYAEYRKQIIGRGVQFLNAVCPPLDSCIPQEVVKRAEKLVELNTTH